jgi:hypothetical protein
VTDSDNPQGRGLLGSQNNLPTLDGGTMALIQNRPNVPLGLTSSLPSPRRLSGSASSVVTPAALTPTPPTATPFHPGVNHAHTPSGRWSAVQANPNSRRDINLLCKLKSPKELVDSAIYWEFGGKPIGLAHLKYYLAGSGADFSEDANIDTWLRTDPGIQSTLAKHIPSGRSSGVYADSFKLEQMDYQDQDFRFAFGAIDILDFEVDFGAKTVHVWFQDRYEWHPFYPGLYTALVGDVARETNCVHAALVELKSSGAADFWMKGEATVPLSVIVPTKSKTSTDDW